MTDEKDPQKVITGECLVDFPHLLATRTNKETGNEEYSCKVFVPKSDKKTVNQLFAAMKAAVEYKFKNKKGVIALYEEAEAEFKRDGKVTSVETDDFRFPLNDADNDHRRDKETGEKTCTADRQPATAGHYWFNVKAFANNPPQVFTRSKRQMSEEDGDKITDGAFLKFSLRAGAYDKGSCGVGFYINGCQFIKQGERIALGGVVDTTDDFEELEEFEEEEEWT